MKIALKVKNPDHLIIGNDRSDHFRSRIVACMKVSGILAKDQNSPIALFTKHHISISGDTALLATLHQAFLEQELDWEGHLAFFIGNTPALMINTLTQKTFKWSHKLMDDRKRDLTLFLQEEQKINPTAFELNHFYDEVDALCEATDRLEHRLLEIQRDGLI